MLSIILDIVVMSLLVLTIVFCWKLNTKIMELKSGRKELLELIKSLDGTILRTHTNINDLKSMSQNSAVELNLLVKKAVENISDLNFINETASKLADRLERNMSDARYLYEKLRSLYQSEGQYSEVKAANLDIPPEGENTSMGIKSGFSRAKKELMSALKIVG